MSKFVDSFLCDGEWSSFIPARDRGFHYGDGLFETILVLDGRPLLLGLHLARLIAGCEKMKINLNEASLKKEFSLQLQEIKKQTGIIKIIITRQEGDRGYFYSTDAKSNRYLQFYSNITYPSAYQSGVKACISDYRLPNNTVLAGLKHLNRLDQVMAKNSFNHHFYQEALLLSEKGEVLEGTTSNLFLVKEGVLQTPLLNKSGVKGVMRQYIIDELAPQQNIIVEEKRITVSDVCNADEIFVCNSVFGLWPVQSLGVKSFFDGDNVGKISRQIQKHVNALGYAALYN